MTEKSFAPAKPVRPLRYPEESPAVVRRYLWPDPQRPVEPCARPDRAAALPPEAPR